ncbi:MAG: hypothetical protein LBV74_01245 [Tannerella sp.]|jgi:hypothetical protein|nr:hypothetical protein [Tannerella sp.]
MKLKTFDLSNSKTVVLKEPTIRISRSAGLISFNKSVTELLAINNGQKIVFVQDEESPRDWFIKKATEPNAFLVRVVDDGRSDLNSTCIVHRIFESIEDGRKKYNAASFRIQPKPVEIDGEEYYLIITSNPMNVADNVKKTDNGPK